MDEDLFSKTADLQNSIPPILDRKTDPFQRGTDNDKILAKWASKWANKYFEDTGESSVHNRGLHYFMVMHVKDTGGRIESPSDFTAWDYYENTDACVSFLNVALCYARYLGYIPFDCIDDDKNISTRITEYRNAPVEVGSDEYLDSIIDSYVDSVFIEFDEKLTKPFHIESWSEKTLPSFIHDVFRANGVDRTVEGGELSLRVMHDFIEILNRNNQDGVALFFSDFDTAGIEMPVNMAVKLMWADAVKKLKPGLRAYIEHVAVTPEQIKKYDLPLMPIKKQEKSKGYRKRTSKFKRQYGVDGGAELQVLSGRPELFKEIVQDVLSHWNGYQDEVDNVIKKMKDDVRLEVRALVEDEMDQYKDEMEVKYNNINDLLSDIESAMPTAKEIATMNLKFEKATTIINESEAESDMSDLLYRIKSRIVFPSADIPHVKKEPVGNYIYDSRRDIADQGEILRKIKSGDSQQEGNHSSQGGKK